MSNLQQVIWNSSLQRVAEVYNIPVQDLRPDMRFGVDLKCSFVSDFKRNELDMLSEDMLDVMNKEAEEIVLSRQLVVETVGDYCMYMVYCYDVNPDEVKYVLHIDQPIEK